MKGPSTCHPDKIDYAKGLCKFCYYRAYRQTHVAERKAYAKKYNASYVRGPDPGRKNKQRRYYLRNRSRIMANTKKRYRANVETAKSYQVAYRQLPAGKLVSRRASEAKFTNLRKRILLKYGSKCAHCGYCQHVEALQVDHVRNDGALHRKNRNTYGIYKDVLEDKSGRFQLLCANCNIVKELTRRRGCAEKRKAER